MKKIKVAVLGATGMVGQRLITLLARHPWFEITVLAASNRSSGKSYLEAVKDRWKLKLPIPAEVNKIPVDDVLRDFNMYSSKVSLVFSALNLDKNTIINLENSLAAAGLAVVSNNSANRWAPDVPMIIPEINPSHLDLIGFQRKHRNWKGLIVVKPNCSIQSFLPVIFALKSFGPEKIAVTTLQAVSGSGRTFRDWPEMEDNVIPFIEGEEEKTQKEPLRILGALEDDKIRVATLPEISATCTRVPVSDGHHSSVSVKFRNSPSLNGIKSSIDEFNRNVVTAGLPSAPEKFIIYHDENDRPQTGSDRDAGHGMSVSCGRFRPDNVFDWKFVALSHNTIRGAAGGSVLTAELLVREGWL